MDFTDIKLKSDVVVVENHSQKIFRGRHITVLLYLSSNNFNDNFVIFQQRMFLV